MLYRINIGKLWYPYQFDALFVLFDSIFKIDESIIPTFRNYLIGCVIDEALGKNIIYEYSDGRIADYLVGLSHELKSIKKKRKISEVMYEEPVSDLSEILIGGAENFDRYYDYGAWSQLIYELYIHLGGSADHKDKIGELLSYLCVDSETYYISIINELVSVKPIQLKTIIEIYEVVKK